MMEKRDFMYIEWLVGKREFELDDEIGKLPLQDSKDICKELEYVIGLRKKIGDITQELKKGPLNDRNKSNV